MKLILLIIFVFISVTQKKLNALAAHGFFNFNLDNNSVEVATKNLQCPKRELSQVNDTLCGVANKTILECHASRVTCENLKGQHWTSVCLFSPSDNVRQNFLANYENYTCQVVDNFGSANCTSELNPTFNFISACNFTFYFCEEGDSYKCLSSFSSVLEGKV